VKIDTLFVYVVIYVVWDRLQKLIHIHQAIYIEVKIMKYGMFNVTSCIILVGANVVSIQELSTIIDDKFKA